MMTGSNPLNSSTNGRHPSLLQQQGCRHDFRDQLRRRAIRNSYECRSLCGTASTQANYSMATDVPQETPDNRKLLPPLSNKKDPPSKQIFGRRSNRIGDVVLNRPKSSSRFGVRSSADRRRSIKRSSSYSSVAVTHTGPTLRNNSSSYVCHTTPVVRASVKDNRSHGYYSHDTMSQHRISNDDTFALKRSSSYSQIEPSPSPPCSTSTLDYGSKTSPHSGSQATSNRTSSARSSSNPHPVGLVFQSPYSDSHGKAYKIWSPNTQPNEAKYPGVFTEKRIVSDHTNFTCGPMKPYNPSGRREPPDIKYSTSSIYRNSYQSPQMRTDYDSHMPTTRYGSSPEYFPAKGIVPTAMSPRSPQQAILPKKVDKRIILHPPRGKKMASLV